MRAARGVVERRVLVLLMMSPLYGQADAGAIWNRTFNDFCTQGDGATTLGPVSTSETLHASLRVPRDHLRSRRRDKTRDYGTPVL